MNALRVLRLGPIARLSLGLVALIVSLVLLADLWLGVVPDPAAAARRTHQRVAENLAMQLTALLEADDTVTLGKTIQQVLARDREMRSITVRRADGSKVVQAGPNDPASASGAAVPGAASTADRLNVPIFSGRERWGEIDIRFVAAAPTTLRSWLAQPGVQMLAVIGFGGFLLCYAYLRRAMQYLDPSASVPDRVRKGFDSLAEGLLIVDQQARIVLANRAFRALHPGAAGDLNGQRIDALGWLTAGAAAGAAPWTRTLQSGAPVLAEPLELIAPDRPPSRLLVSTSAITDTRGQARGCLVTFDDVTAVHRANEELRSTLAQLECSRERIEEQNGELRQLASRDSLTGCFNRRAFFELAADRIEAARREQGALCCLMVDIDHFKQFNDVYGHAVGDQVIRVVARALAAALREFDVLGRYGGEEFCVVLPGAQPHEALAVAERMRVDIEANARSAIRGVEVGPIKASFGVAAIGSGARNIEALIDQADQALYQSKQAGRNRVTLWERARVAAPVAQSGPDQRPAD